MADVFDYYSEHWQAIRSARELAWEKSNAALQPFVPVYHHHSRCADCGLEYGRPGWSESYVHPSDWYAILPECPADAIDGLVLCIPCIKRRGRIHGVNVRVSWFICGMRWTDSQGKGMGKDSPSIIESHGDTMFKELMLADPHIRT